MAALVRAAPCPRLLLRSTTTSSSKAPSSSSSPPRRNHAVDAQMMRCYIRCFASSARCARVSAAGPRIASQQAQQRRSFRATGDVRSDLAKKNHYDRLQVSPTATPAEIKKSFYRLSKAHHPDANRNDPNAAHTFSLLSESYTLLSDPARRAVYDRDVMQRILRSSSSSSTTGAPQHGSYHSSAYSAGGRPASGLSKRRGTFRGPPPSFYRNGGWGAQSEKRRRAYEETASASTSAAGGAGASSSSSSSSSSAHYTNYESASAGDTFKSQQDPGGRFSRAEEDVPPHFDKEAHRRTHEKEDQRRWARERRKRALDDDDVEFEPQASLGAHFAIVLGILGATVLVPVWYLNMVSGKKKQREY